jgi:hypothetical protein
MPKKIAKGANIRRQSWRMISLTALRTTRHPSMSSLGPELANQPAQKFLRKSEEKVLTFPREPN